MNIYEYLYSIKKRSNLYTMESYSKMILASMLWGLFSGCGSPNGYSQQKLPEKLPENFSINYRNGGGMRPESNGLYISKDSCYMEYFSYRANNKIHFNITESELNALYQVFFEQKFDKIKTYEQRVHDRGGTSLSLSLGTNTITVSNGGMNFVEKKWEDAYQKCLDALLKLAKEKTEPLKLGYEIQFDKSITKSGHLCYFNIPDTDFYHHSEEMGMPNKLSVQLFPGEHSLQLNLVSNTQPVHERKSIASESFLISLKPTDKGVLLGLEEGKITYKVF